MLLITGPVSSEGLRSHKSGDAIDLPVIGVVKGWSIVKTAILEEEN